TTIGSDEPDRDAGDITTFHAAKGLEWPIVHVAGLERGLVSIGHAKSEAALAEARRLFYVTITRAVRELRCTRAEHRTIAQRSVACQLSPYLEALEHAASLDGSPALTRWSGLIRSERAKLAAGTGTNRAGGGRCAKAGSDLSPDDQPVFEALKQWRSTKAR